MNLTAVNYLNIAFMILASIIAFYLPFELTLFSYVVLGPLHYLTEIPWLQKRQFFMPGKRDYLWFAVLASAIFFPAIFRYVSHFVYLKNANGTIIYPYNVNRFFQYGRIASRFAVLLAMVSAVIFVSTTNFYKRAIAIIAFIAWGVIFRAQAIAITFSALSLTLVHVYIFTGVFMLSGALKSKSFSGILSLFVFLGCSVLLLLVPALSKMNIGNYVINSYNVSFYSLNKQLFSIFLKKKASVDDIYYSAAGITIARFVAFAYFYHYLNWFSKTSIIGWHRISRQSLITVVVIWIGSISVYIYDFRMGLATQFFLSALHVIFEYPLNVQSFKDVGKNLRLMVVRK